MACKICGQGGILYTLVPALALKRFPGSSDDATKPPPRVVAGWTPAAAEATETLCGWCSIDEARRIQGVEAYESSSNALRADREPVYPEWIDAKNKHNQAPGGHVVDF